MSNTTSTTNHHTHMDSVFHDLLYVTIILISIPTFCHDTLQGNKGFTMSDSIHAKPVVKNQVSTYYTDIGITIGITIDLSVSLYFPLLPAW